MVRFAKFTDTKTLKIKVGVLSVYNTQ